MEGNTELFYKLSRKNYGDIIRFAILNKKYLKDMLNFDGKISKSGLLFRGDGRVSVLFVGRYYEDGAWNTQFFKDESRGKTIHEWAKLHSEVTP